jgi:surfeit locus 1 family protein
VPIVRIPIGERVFAPVWWTTAVTLALCILFVILGRWQWNRGDMRQAQWDAFAHGSSAARAIGANQLRTMPNFQRVAINGHYDTERQFLLDNRTHAGRAGYDVLTPFELSNGHDLMVDRGWVPFTGYRAILPDVHLSAAASLTVSGRLENVPVGGLALGRMPPDSGPSWPKVTTYPTMAQLANVLRRPVEQRVLFLDPTEPNGYVRDWQPPGLPPIRHWSYAVQWWGFAAALLVIWAILSAPKPRAAV